MALIIPPPGGLKDTARLLLALAGDVPEIVRTVSAGNAFEVPDALADAYTEAVSRPAAAPSRRGRKPRTNEE